MAIRESVALDVSHLPTCAFGHRDPLWWGIILAIAIETTAFAIGWATYLYLRMQEATWPPWGWSTPNLLIGAISTIAILASGVPMYLLDKESKRMDVRRVRFLLIVFYAISLVVCAIRVWEFIALQVKWDSNAYGSIVWALLTLHTVHVVTSMAEGVDVDGLRVSSPSGRPARARSGSDRRVLVFRCGVLDPQRNSDLPRPAHFELI